MRSFHIWLKTSRLKVSRLYHATVHSFLFCLKVSRLHHAIAGALATWVTALLSDGESWVSTVKVAAPASMFVSIIAASLFHHGAAHAMYRRKEHDYLELDQPWVLTMLGVVGFVLSMAIAWRFLPPIGLGIACFNAIAIILYARVFARHWATKNLLIAAVCTTPVLLGWWIGHRLHPGISLGIMALFFSQLAREMMKDVMDIKANHGLRVTLPMVMGVRTVRQLADVTTAVSAICLLLLCLTLAPQMTVLTMTFLAVSVALLLTITSTRRFIHLDIHLITLSNWFTLLAFLGLRVSRL